MDRNHTAETLARHLAGLVPIEVGAAILAELYPVQPIDPAQFPVGLLDDDGHVTMKLEFPRRSVELDHLHATYYRELGEPYDMDWDWLADKANRAEVAMFTARKDGVLVGAMRVFLLRNQAAGGRLEARDNLFFIYREHRDMRLAVALWRYAERSMFDYGVRKVSFQSLGGAPAMARYLGYKPTGTLFSKTHQGEYETLPTRHAKD